MIYRLEHLESPDADVSFDTYSLMGTSCTTLTGSADEWLSIAQAIHQRGKRGFSHAAIRYLPEDHMFAVFCPEKRLCKDDHDLLLVEDADVLAHQIKICIRKGRSVVLQNFDPVI